MLRVIKVGAAAVGVALLGVSVQQARHNYLLTSPSVSPDRQWAQLLTPHGRLEARAPNLWQVTSILSASPFLSWPRNMTVYRHKDGTLILHNPIVLDDEGMEKLATLGSPDVLIAPNSNHCRDISAYKRRFPDATVLCPGDCVEKVEEVVAVDATCEEFLCKNLELRVYRPGMLPNGYNELVYELPLEESVLLRMTFKGFGMSTSPRIAKSSIFFHYKFPKHVPLLERWLEKVLESSHSVELLLFTHGPPIRTLRQRPGTERPVVEEDPIDVAEIPASITMLDEVPAEAPR